MESWNIAMRALKPDAGYHRFSRDRRKYPGGSLKLASTGAKKEALFDLSDDPGESKNLSIGRPEDVKKLKSLFDAWNSQMQASRWWRSGAGAATPRRLLNPNANLGPAQVQRQFDELDANKDGKLTAAEFARPALFRRMDGDGDSILNLEEVRKFFTRQRA
jgi:hypothetical protein